MPENDTPPIVIKLPDDLQKIIEERAGELGRTPAELAKMMLAKMLNDPR